MDSLEFLSVRSPTNQYIIFNKVLGKGAFGVVLLSKQMRTQQLYAMKIISKVALKKCNGSYNIRQEILFLAKLNHQNIIKMFETFEDNDYFYIVLEYCAMGNLYNELKQKGQFTEEKAFKYFYQIVLAVQYLHQKQIIHRDIKLDNILLSDQDQIKICDFNWATNLVDGSTGPVLCGTLDQMPPEVSSFSPHDKKLDVWSLGIILYQMVHDSLPIISYATELSVGRRISLELQHLLLKLLQLDKEKRPTTEEILQHKWIQKHLNPKKSNSNSTSQSISPRCHSKQSSYGSTGISKYIKTEV